MGSSATASYLKAPRLPRPQIQDYPPDLATTVIPLPPAPLSAPLPQEPTVTSSKS